MGEKCVPFGLFYQNLLIFVVLISKHLFHAYKVPEIVRSVLQMLPINALVRFSYPIYR